MFIEMLNNLISKDFSFRLISKQMNFEYLFFRVYASICESDPSFEYVSYFPLVYGLLFLLL